MKQINHIPIPGEAAQRRLHLLLSCHPDADPLQDFSLLSALEPPSDGGCEDLALEWRTLLACPVCQEGQAKSYARESYVNICIYIYVMYTYVWRLRVMSAKNSGCDLSEPAQVIGRLSHLRDVTQYAVSESPLLRPQTALEERSRPRIIGSHVLVWLGDQNFDVDLDDYCWCVVLTCWGQSPGCIGHRCFQPQKCRHRF